MDHHLRGITPKILPINPSRTISDPGQPERVTHGTGLPLIRSPQLTLDHLANASVQGRPYSDRPDSLVKSWMKPGLGVTPRLRSMFTSAQAKS
jgi:hypothetical protein